MAKGKKTGGRTKGSVNRITRSMKDTVADTLDWLQDQPRANMRDWATENPTEFYKIAARLIPTELTGAQGQPLIPPITTIEIIHTNEGK